MAKTSWIERAKRTPKFKVRGVRRRKDTDGTLERIAVKSEQSIPRNR